MQEIGKQVGSRHYVGIHQVGTLPEEAKELLARGQALLPHAELVDDINVLRIDPARKEVAFLSYPELGCSPFPALKSSWRVDLLAGLVNNRRYDRSLNPPILHRTELLLTEDHPARGQCEALTRDCEAIGLFEHPTRIGFQQQWADLVHSRGYQIQGFQLVPVGNVDSEERSLTASDELVETQVARHLTALTRNTLSAPVQRLISDGLLTPAVTFFDYGCGRGDDLAGLQANAFNAAGWDPHFNPDGTRRPADVVNIGFVINVIEDRAERCEALEGAFALTQQVLAVAAMLGNNDASKGRQYRDGVLTSRQTFQKYYSQQELRQFIESVLDEEAYPAAPGVFYVFRDRELEQRYLLNRTSNGARVRQILVQLPKNPRTLLASTRPIRRVPRRQPVEVRIPEFVTDALQQLWRSALELGRAPEQDEVAESAVLSQHFRSWNRAWSYCLDNNDAQALQLAARGRRDDILVMLALRTFDRRRKFGKLDQRLGRDIKSLFGTLREAEATATQLLFSLQDTAVIDSACQVASTDGLGWLDPGESLQLHTSLINRLPAVLRAYIGCASIMAGDLTGYDLVKAHIRSGKVSLMAYDDFDGKPFPLLQRRVKVRLRDQALDIFEYGDEHPPSTLFRKARYINEELPRYAEQVQIEEQLERLNLFDLKSYGVSENAFNDKLAARRYCLNDFSLTRSTAIPDLDAPCGANYRYRDLVECGETWHSTRVSNVPASPETYNALCDLCTQVLDPVIEYFGAIELTYGFASASLTKSIAGRIAPELDQHASHEITRRGNRICPRAGAAVDFLVRDEHMLEVAKWIAANCLYDRIYLYGQDRPIHVSVGPENTRTAYYLEERSGRRVPRPVDLRTL